LGKIHGSVFLAIVMRHRGRWCGREALIDMHRETRSHFDNFAARYAPSANQQINL
jgi:hypothetical protein